MFKSISDAIYKMIIVVCIVIAVLLFGLQLRYTSTIYMNSFVAYKENLISNIFCVIMLVFCVALLSFLLGRISLKSSYVVVIICSIFTLAFDIYFAYNSKNYVVGDQAHVYTAACSLVEGSSTWIQDDGDYFIAYQNQFFLVHLFAFIFKLTRNTSVFVLQIFQAICNSASVFFAFVIARKVSKNQNITTICPIIFALYPPFHLSSLFVYGDTIAVSFLIIGIGVYVSANSEKKAKCKIALYLLSMISIVMSCLLRPSLITVTIAILVISVIKKKIDGVIIAVVSIVLYSFASLFFSKMSFKECGIAMQDGAPTLAYVAMGMQDDGNVFDAPGYHNGYDIVTLRNANYDADVASQAAREYIRKRVVFFKDNIDYAYEFYKGKITVQWTNPDYDFFYCTSYHDPQLNWIKRIYEAWGGIGTKIFDVLNVIQCALTLMLVIYFVTLLNGREDDNSNILIPGLFVIGGFFSSVLWEACSRYTYPYAIVSIICCSIAIERVIGCVKENRGRS